MAESLYDNGRTLHKLVGLGVDDMDCRDATASSSSRCGLHSDCKELPQKAALIFVYEAISMDQSLLEMVDVVLKHLLCHSTNSLNSTFGGICVLFPSDNQKMHPVAPFCKWVEDEQGNGGYVDVYLLEQSP